MLCYYCRSLRGAWITRVHLGCTLASYESQQKTSLYLSFDELKGVIIHQLPTPPRLTFVVTFGGTFGMKSFQIERVGILVIRYLPSSWRSFLCRWVHFWLVHVIFFRLFLFYCKISATISFVFVAICFNKSRIHNFISIFF